MRQRCKPFLFVLLTLLLFPFPSVLVSAEEAIEAPASVPPLADWLKETELLFVSDSLLKGTSDHLEILAPESDLDAVSGRVMASTDKDAKDVLSAIQTTRHPIVFVVMGLDNPVDVGEIETVIQTFLDEEAKHKMSHLVFVTSGSQTPHRQTYNTHLKEMKKKYPDITWVDWASFVESEGVTKHYEKNGQYLLFPEQFYQYVIEQAYQDISANLPTITKEEFVEVSTPEEVHLNPELKEGEERVVQRGKPGRKIIRTTTPAFMGQPIGEPIVEEVVVEEPTPTILYVGAGTVREQVNEELRSIPYRTQRVEDPNLDLGVEETRQAGIDGTLSVREVTTYLGDVPQGDPVIQRTVIREPTDEVIVVGTGVKEVVEEITTQPIPFETKEIEDPLLKAGDRVVSQEGVEGELEITTKTPTFNGQQAGEPVVSERIVKEPVDHIIKVGTGSEEEAIYEAEPQKEEGNRFPWGLVVGGVMVIVVGVSGVVLYRKLNESE